VVLKRESDNRTTRYSNCVSWTKHFEGFVEELGGDGVQDGKPFPRIVHVVVGDDTLHLNKCDFCKQVWMKELFAQPDVMAWEMRSPGQGHTCNCSVLVSVCTLLMDACRVPAVIAL
jgi:hypothetical protein